LRFNVAYIQTMSQGSGNVADKDPANAFNPGVKELTRSKEDFNVWFIQYMLKGY